MKRMYRARLGAILLVAAAIGCSRSDSSQTLGGAKSSSTPASGGAPAATCDLLSPGEIVAAVGNPVLKGQQYSMAGDCKWDTENRDDVSVLLIVQRKGSIREPYLCEELRKTGGSGERVEGLDVATWKFSNTLGLFNSGEFEACGAKGFLSLQLNGKRDEAALKKATLAIVRQILQRL